MTEKQSLFLHIQVHANSQTKLWSKAQKCGVAHFTCVRLFYAMLNDFEKKSDCFAVFSGDPLLDLNLKLYSHVTIPT